MTATRTRRTAAPKPAAELELAVPETPDPAAPEANGSLRTRAAKAPSQLHKDFAEWLTANTGHETDPKTVQLTITLLSEYQKSPERQAARGQAQRDRQTTLAERKAATEKKAAERKAKLEAQLAAIQAKLGE